MNGKKNGKLVLRYGGAAAAVLLILALLVAAGTAERQSGGTGSAGGEPDGAAADPEAAAGDFEQSAQRQMQRLIALSARFGVDPTQDGPAELPPEYQNQEPLPSGHSQFKTEFARAAVPFGEIIAGGPPKDGIPSIDNPVFESVVAADRYLSDREPVILLRLDGHVRVYPLRVLTWHEIVNDELAGHPVAVTYCPLCNTAMVFSRRSSHAEGATLEFGVSGRLIYSNMLMYDRETESWWIQATGTAVVGEMTGARLRLLPSSLLSWADVRSSFPDAEVLSRDTGYARDYGRNPYQGYDGSARPLLYRGPSLAGEGENPMQRVLSVYHGESVRAVGYNELFQNGVLQFELEDVPIVAFGRPGTASALDTSRISDGRDVGSAVAFYATHNGQALEFEAVGGFFYDSSTGSRWDITGMAVAGPLAGARLEQALSVEHFLFSHLVFNQ